MQKSRPLNDSSSVQDVLSRTLSFLSKDWVKQFLFKSTPESDLSIFTSKQHMKNAFAGKLHVSCNGPPSNISSFFLSNLKANWVFIPAFCVEEYSANILIKEDTATDLPPWIPHQRTQYVRMVRNEDTGDCLCVFMNAEADFIDVKVFLWDSPEHRHRCFMRFKKDTMLNAVLADGPVNLARIAPGALFLVHVDEHRVCNTCNPFGIGGVCVCASQRLLRRPRFVLDGATPAQNMLTLAGSFTGKVIHPMYFNYVAKPFDPATTHGGLTGGNEQGVIPRLLSWSISNCLTNAVLAPSCFPGLSQLPSYHASTSMEEDFPCTVECEPSLFGIEHDYGLHLAVPNDAQNAQVEFETSGSPYEDVADGRALSQSDGSRATTFVRSDEGSIQGSGQYQSDSAAPFLPDYEVRHERPMAETLQADSGLIPRVVASVNAAVRPAVGNALHRTAGSEVEPFILPQGELTNYPTGSAHIPYFVPLTANLRPMNLGANIPLSSVRDENEAKELQRKLRNRESAARSNLKKQMRGKELKGQISVEVGKMGTLQRRLKALQEENQVLRGRVAGDASVA